MMSNCYYFLSAPRPAAAPEHNLGRKIPPMPAPTFEVQTPTQARLLLRLEDFAVVGLLMERDVSISEAARHTGIDLKRVHRIVSRLEDAGLAQVVGVQTRRGRPVKIYRAVAAVFRIPLRLCERPVLEEHLYGLHAPFLRQFLDTASQSIALGRRETGEEPSITLDSGRGPLVYVRQPGGAVDAPISSFGTLKLSAGSRRELSRRFANLQRWVMEEAEKDENDEECVLGFMLARL